MWIYLRRMFTVEILDSAPFWEQVFDATGKPAFITEYGAPAYAKHLTLEEWKPRRRIIM